MRSILAVTIACCCVATASARTEAEQVSRLVARLGSPSFREREAANIALEAKGEQALVELRLATSSGDSETARRATELIRRIERRMTAAKLLTPTTVEITIDNLTLAEAVREFSRQSQLPVIVTDAARVGERRVTYKSGKVSVWEALAGFNKASGLADWDGATKGPGLPTAGVPDEGTGSVIIRQNGNPIIVQRSIRSSQSQAPQNIFLYDATSTPNDKMRMANQGAVRVRLLPVPTPLPNAVADADEIVVPLQVSLEPKLTWNGPPSLSQAKAIDDRGFKTTGSLVGTSSTRLDEQVLLMNNRLGMEPANPFAGQRGQLFGVRFRRGQVRTGILTDVSGMLTLPLRATGVLASVDSPLKAAGQSQRTKLGVGLTVSAIEKAENGDVKLDVSTELPPGISTSRGLFARQDVFAGNIQFQVQNGVVVPPGGAANNLTEFQGLTLSDALGGKYKVAAMHQQTNGVSAEGTKIRLVITLRPPTNSSEPARLTLTGTYPATVEVPFSFADVQVP